MTSSLSLLIVVLGLLLSSCDSRRCYKCDGESSLDKCDINTCSSGPECCLYIYEDSSGQITYYGDCASPNSCKRPHTSHEGTRLCGECCYEDECVPESCQKYQPYKLNEGVTCEQCSGGDCGVYPGVGPEWKCDNNIPYCLNIVTNNEDGSKHVSKSCGSKADCDSLWWNDSRGRKTCTNFDPSNIHTSNFTCSYCCMTEHCNRDIRPQEDTLYMN